MWNISEGAATTIRVLGGLLLLAAFVVLFHSKSSFEAMTNYQRLAFVSAALAGKPMLFVDLYRKPPTELDDRMKLWKFLFVAAPIATAIGAVIWYVADPAAKA